VTIGREKEGGKESERRRDRDQREYKKSFFLS
jgi:hypothetical protein